MAYKQENILSEGFDGLSSGYGSGGYSLYKQDGSLGNVNDLFKINLSQDDISKATTNGNIDSTVISGTNSNINGLSNNGTNNNSMFSGFSDFLGSDSAKNTIGSVGLAVSGLGILNGRKALAQAKKQWESEDARANKIMAINEEKYNTFKADKEKLNSGYSSGGLANG